MDMWTVVRGFVLAGAMLVSVAPAGTAGERHTSEPSQGGRGALSGSWMETTSIPGGAPFSGLLTFGGDGGLVSSYQGSVVLGGPAAGSYSAGHGRWIHERGRTFSTTSVSMVSSFDDTLRFVITIRQRITLNASRDAYESVVRAEFADPSGNLLFVLEGTTRARRINVDPLP
jgi:hypothetical protein